MFGFDYTLNTTYICDRKIVAFPCDGDEIFDRRVLAVSAAVFSSLTV